jgi:glutaredoxin 3
MSASNAGVVMYTTSWCPYCARARQLFDAKGLKYTDIDVESAAGARDEMQQRSGRTSVPQIFIGDRHLGGYDDASALDRRGELEPLLLAAREANAS